MLLEKKKTHKKRQLKRVRIISLDMHHPSAKAAQLNDEGNPLRPQFLPRRKMSEHLASPRVQDTAQDAHFFLTSPGKLRRWAQLRDRERLGAQQSGLRTHQRTVEVSRAPSRRPSVSCLGYLSCGAPSWPRGNPNAPRASPPPASWLTPMRPDRW